ncbi:MAG: nucleotide exchange factor GrpE [Crocinitomicaceae bacterium]|nr:nucleotide exchange factor GrpE [Crocinitomicaceae bacterium]
MSKKKDKKKEETVDQVENSEKDVMDNSEESTEKKSDKSEETKEKSLEEKYEELQSKYLLLYSDFDNFRKRTIKEKAETLSRASGDVIKDLLVVLDDFERAISTNENVDDPEAVKEGFKLIHHKMLNILQSKGLEAMDAKGEPFDSDKHEAITQIPVEDEDQKGKVVDVVERGYNLKGSVLRYAKVVVGQ